MQYKKFFFLFFYFTPVFIFARYNKITFEQQPFVVMINQSNEVGRKIEDSFERGLIVQCAEKLKKVLEQKYPAITVILAQCQKDTVTQLHNASFANRLAVDFFLSLHFYQTTDTKPHLFLYQFSYNDSFITTTSDLAFYSYDQAHLFLIKKTEEWLSIVKKNLESDYYKKLFMVQGIYKLPFKSLIGIKAPAVGIEIGLKNKIYLELIFS